MVKGGGDLGIPTRITTGIAIGIAIGISIGIAMWSGGRGRLWYILYIKLRTPSSKACLGNEGKNPFKQSLFGEIFIHMIHIYIYYIL